MNSIWRDCKKQPPLVDDGELVLMDSNDKFWVGFCSITSDGVSYFANNAEPLKNDFVKYARIEKLLALETELERTRKELEQSETCCTEWEKQALDYKAENIALSGDLERTRKALEVAVDALKNIGASYPRITDIAMQDKANTALEQITAEQKD